MADTPTNPEPVPTQEQGATTAENETNVNLADPKTAAAAKAAAAAYFLLKQNQKKRNKSSPTLDNTNTGGLPGALPVSPQEQGATTAENETNVNLADPKTAAAAYSLLKQNQKKKSETANDSTAGRERAYARMEKMASRERANASTAGNSLTSAEGETNVNLADPKAAAAAAAAVAAYSLLRQKGKSKGSGLTRALEEVSQGHVNTDDGNNNVGSRAGGTERF